jgi:hypothetical protein
MLQGGVTMFLWWVGGGLFFESGVEGLDGRGQGSGPHPCHPLIAAPAIPCRSCPHVTLYTPGNKGGTCFA